MRSNTYLKLDIIGLRADNTRNRKIISVLKYVLAIRGLLFAWTARSIIREG